LQQVVELRENARYSMLNYVAWFFFTCAVRASCGNCKLNCSRSDLFGDAQTSLSIVSN